MGELLLEVVEHIVSSAQNRSLFLYSLARNRCAVRALPVPLSPGSPVQVFKIDTLKLGSFCESLGVLYCCFSNAQASLKREIENNPETRLPL